MNKNLLRSLALSAALSIASIGAASAGVINFSTDSLGKATPVNTSLGGTFVFSGGLTAYAGNVLTWSGTCGQADTSTTPSSTNPCLYYKVTNGDPSETGLGLTPLASNEISNPYGIMLSSSSGYIGSIELGSVQSGESWQVLGCSNSKSPTACSVLASGIGSTNGSTVTLTGLGSFADYVVDVPCQNNVSYCNPGLVPGAGQDPGATYGGNNVLLMSVTTVPEPGTLALFAAGLLGCLLFVRRRVRQH